MRGRPLVRRSFLVWVAAFLVTLLIGCFAPARFRYDSFCSVCGMRRASTEWQVGRSVFNGIESHSLFTSHSLETTPLSAVLFQKGLVSKHEHRWCFAHGDGNGVRCAVGAGDQLRNVAERREVTNFVVTLVDYTDKTTTQKWVERLLDPEGPSQWRHVLYYLGREDVKTKDVFVKRLEETEAFIAEDVETMKETGLR